MKKQTTFDRRKARVRFDLKKKAGDKKADAGDQFSD